MAKVVVGMSGGVDSAVAAYLLNEAGHEVVGLTLRTWLSDDGDEGRCCEIDDARRVAQKLGIAYHTLNCFDDFREKVTEPFVRAYIDGLTPNPCIECNRYVKWERMLYFADVVQADFVATGHYAYVVKLPNGRYTVKKAAHVGKDQTYMLYKLSQDQLARTLMPLGGLSKDEVREIAKREGLPVAEKADSQDICFVPDGSHAEYIEANAKDGVPGEGNFVDGEGKVTGRHKGITRYTVGQRKGLGLALGYPAFVKEIRPETNEVLIGSDSSLYGRELVCGDANFLSVPGLAAGEKLSCTAKIRYRHEGTAASIEALGDGIVKVSFAEPVRAATPGQSAVFYDADGCVIGGGIIRRK